MQPVTKEFSTGEILGRGFSLFRQQFPRIVVPLFFGALIAALLRLLFAYETAPLTQRLATYTNITNATAALQAFSIITQLFGYLVLQTFALFVVSVPFFAMALKIAYDSSNEKTPSLKAGFSIGFRRLPSLLLAGVIVGSLVTIGLILIVVPGVIFTVMFLMFIPAIVVENESGLGSLGRSRQLASHRWGVVFLVALVALIITVLLNTLFGNLFGFLDLYSSSIVQPLYGLIPDVLGVSLLAVLYQSLRIKEGGEPGSQIHSLTTPSGTEGPAPNG